MNIAGQGTRPFLKWAGNKFRVLDRIRAKLPVGGRLIEPFTGSGALFLNTDYRHYLLGDSNQDLIGLYKALQMEGPAFINECRNLFRPGNNHADAYYRLRAEFNACGDPRQRAALFVYLNRHGWNGLCRYNTDGAFNVPFGKYKHPRFPEEEMRRFCDRSRHAEFVHADFDVTIAQAQAGDVIYCDPPYLPLSKTANFTAYNGGVFSLNDQQRLVDSLRAAVARGASVLVSNHDTAESRALYAGAHVESFMVQRNINCKGDRRGPVGEILASF